MTTLHNGGESRVSVRASWAGPAQLTVTLNIFSVTPSVSQQTITVFSRLAKRSLKPFVDLQQLIRSS